MNVNVDLKAFRAAIAHDDGNLVLNDKKDALVKQNRGASKFTKYTRYVLEQTQGNAEKNAEVRNALYNAIKATHDETICHELMDSIKSRLGLVDGDENAGNRTELLKRGEVREILADVDRWDKEKESIKTLVEGIADWKLPNLAKKGASVEEILLSDKATDMQFVLSEVMKKVDADKKDKAVTESAVDSCLARACKEDAAKIKSELTKSLQYVCLKKVIEDYRKNSTTELMVRVNGDKVQADNKYRDVCIEYLNKEIGKAAETYAKALNALERRLAPYAKFLEDCDRKIDSLKGKTGDQAKPKTIAQLECIRSQVLVAAMDVLQGKHCTSMENGSMVAKSVCTLAFGETDPAEAANEQKLHDDSSGAMLKLLNRGFKALDAIISNGDVKDDEVIDKFLRQLRADEISKGIGEALSDKGPKGFLENVMHFKISDKLADYVFDETKNLFYNGKYIINGVVDIVALNTYSAAGKVAEVCASLNSDLDSLRKCEEREPVTEEQVEQCFRDAKEKANGNQDKCQNEINLALKPKLTVLAYKRAKEELNIGDVRELKDPKRLRELNQKHTDCFFDMVATFDGIDSKIKEFFDEITTKDPKKPPEKASPDEWDLYNARTKIRDLYKAAENFDSEGLARVIGNAKSFASRDSQKRFVLTGDNPLATDKGKVDLCNILLPSNTGNTAFLKLCQRAKVYAVIAGQPAVKKAFNAMGAAAAKMKDGELPNGEKNWVNDLKAKFTFANLPALKEAREKYGSISLAEEGLAKWCDEMITQIQDDLAERRFSLCDRISQLGIKDHIDIVDGKPLPAEVEEFVSGKYLEGLVNKAIEGVTAGAKRFLEGMGRLEQKIQQINPDPEEFLAGKPDEKGGPVKFTLKARSEAREKEKTFAKERGLSKLVDDLTMKLKMVGPLVNPFRDEPVNDEKLWKEIDGQIAELVRNANVSTFVKRDEFKDYNMFDGSKADEKHKESILNYTYKIIDARKNVMDGLKAQIGNQEAGKAYDATFEGYSSYVLFNSLSLTGFSDEPAIDKGYLTDIGKEPMSESERAAKLAARKKIVDMNLLLEKAIARKLKAMAEKSTSFLGTKYVAQTVGAELTKGMTDAVSGYEKAFKRMLLDKIDQSQLAIDEQELKKGRWINTLIKERAIPEAERFLAQGDDYRLDKAALTREVEKTIRALFLNSVDDGNGKNPFMGLSAALAAPENKETFVQGVDALRQKKFNALKAYGAYLPSTEDLWAEYLQAGPFADYFETNGSGKIVIAPKKNLDALRSSVMQKDTKKRRGGLVGCVNDNFTDFAKRRIEQIANAVQRYDADVKAALHTKGNTGLLDRFGLPADYQANLPHDTLLKGYLAGVPKPGKGVDTVAQLQAKILESEAGRGLVEAGIKRINDQLAQPESQNMVRNGWTVTSSGFLSSTTTTYTGLNVRQEKIKNELGIDIDPKPIFDKIFERTVRMAVESTHPGKNLSAMQLVLNALSDLDMYLDLAIDNLKPVKKQAEEEKSFAKEDKDKLKAAIQGVLTKEMSQIAKNLDLKNRTIIGLPNDIRQAVKRNLPKA